MSDLVAAYGFLLDAVGELEAAAVSEASEWGEEASQLLVTELDDVGRRIVNVQRVLRGALADQSIGAGR